MEVNWELVGGVAGGTFLAYLLYLFTRFFLTQPASIPEAGKNIANAFLKVRTPDSPPAELGNPPDGLRQLKEDDAVWLTTGRFGTTETWISVEPFALSLTFYVSGYGFQRLARQTGDGFPSGRSVRRVYY